LQPSAAHLRVAERAHCARACANLHLNLRFCGEGKAKRKRFARARATPHRRVQHAQEGAARERFNRESEDTTFGGCSKRKRRCSGTQRASRTALLVHQHKVNPSRETHQLANAQGQELGLQAGCHHNLDAPASIARD
jgi:hypothetical protein